jgi:hypothetical protein
MKSFLNCGHTTIKEEQESVLYHTSSCCCLSFLKVSGSTNFITDDWLSGEEKNGRGMNIQILIVLIVVRTVAVKNLRGFVEPRQSS